MTKSLIIYYSWSEAANTKHIAEIIRQQTEADVFRVKTVKPYPDTYAACVAKAGMDILSSTLPELQKLPESLNDYDRIFLGTPIWWGNMSQPIKSLVKQVNFSGKKLLPFCTNGGGGKGKYFARLSENCKGATIGEGIAFLKNGGPEAEQQIKAWLEKNKNML